MSFQSERLTAQFRSLKRNKTGDFGPGGIALACVPLTRILAYQSGKSIKHSRWGEIFSRLTSSYNR